MRWASPRSSSPSAGSLGIAQALQRLGDRALQVDVERGRGVQVEVFDLGQALGAQQRRERRARRCAGGGCLRRVGFVAGRVRLVHRHPGGQRGVAQALVDDALARQQVQVAVGQAGQAALAGPEVVGGLALRDEQAQDLAEATAALAQRARLGAGVAQRRVHRGEVGAVPRGEAVAQAVDLAAAGQPPERQAVEVVHDDAAPGGHGVLAVAVGAHGGGDHVAPAIGDGDGASFRTVAVALGADREGAAHAVRRVAIDAAHGFIEQRAHEAHRLDRGIAGAGRRGQELPVLDEQQRAAEHRRNGVEVVVGVLRMPHRLHGTAGAVEQAQARLRLFRVRRVVARSDELRQRRGLACLGFDRPAARGKLLDELRQPRVAVAPVHAPVGRVCDGGAGAGQRRSVQFAGHARQVAGLEERPMQFDRGSGTQRDERDQPRPGRDAAESAA
jgi:hypothetical protein